MVPCNLDVGSESAGGGNLLSGQFGEFAHVELRCIELKLDGTDFEKDHLLS